jgi:hypothetical protein
MHPKPLSKIRKKKWTTNSIYSSHYNKKSGGINHENSISFQLYATPRQLLSRQYYTQDQDGRVCATAHPEIVKGQWNFNQSLHKAPSIPQTILPKTADGVETAGTRCPGKEEREQQWWRRVWEAGVLGGGAAGRGIGASAGRVEPLTVPLMYSIAAYAGHGGRLFGRGVQW